MDGRHRIERRCARSPCHKTTEEYTKPTASESIVEADIAVIPSSAGRSIEVALRFRDYALLAAAVLVTTVSAEVILQLPEYLERFVDLGLATASMINLRDLLGVASAGFFAQLIDGALGMGYGVTSSTVLVAFGLSPTTASASVHLAQVGTTLASGIAHHRHGNVDWDTVRVLAPPGSLGAFFGAVLLSSLPESSAKSITSSLLFGLGFYVFARFYMAKGVAPSTRSGTMGRTLLTALGAIGGFVDATGGGGWGPIATSALLADGSLLPSRAIGAVSASEFLVTVSAVLGFLVTLGAEIGGSGVRLDLVAVLLLGGVLAAPIAPILVTKLHPNLVGVLVGGFTSLTNARGVLKACGASSAAHMVLHIGIAILWVSGSLVVGMRSGS